MPGRPTFEFSYGSIYDFAGNSGIAILLLFVAVMVLAKYLPETRAFKAITLGAELTPDKGFRSSPDMQSMIGQRGAAATPLHPSGIGIFGSKRVDVVARGAFIEKDSPIVVAEAHGNRIVVDAVEEGKA